MLQFFLAGLGVFGAASFSPHATLGTLLGITSLILLILAVLSVLMGTLSRRGVTLAALLFALMVLQWLLVEVFLTVPALVALHPVNGLLIVTVAYALAARQHRAQPAERRRRPRV